MSAKINQPRIWGVELIGAYYFRAPNEPIESRRVDPPATLIVMLAGTYRARAGLTRKAAMVEGRAGDVIYWPAGKNRVEIGDMDHPARCVVCQFEWFNPTVDLPQTLHDYDRLLAQLGNHLVALHGEPSGLPPEVANGYLSAMLAEYCRLAQMNLPPLVAWVSRFTEENLRHPFQLADLAKGVHLHPCHLVRQYRRLTGMTPMNFVRRRRAERAIGLLLNDPSSSPLEVARRVGLNNALSLKRLIKHYTGLSVRELRARRPRHPTPTSPVPFIP